MVSFYYNGISDMIPKDKTSYSSLRPFMCFTTNQFAQQFKFVANLITYVVNICIIY